MSDPSTFTKNIPIIASIGAVGVYASIVLGQIVRVPVFGQSGGLLTSDIALLLYIGIIGILVAFRSIPAVYVYPPMRAYIYLIAPFFLYVLVGLAVDSQLLAWSDFAVALLYALRLLAISLIFPGFWLIARMPHGHKLLVKGFVITYISLLVLGYTQIWLFPSLVGNIQGWDPHIHRMIATWFDPNFFGGYIALCIVPVLYWSRRNIPLFVVGAGAFALTGSRSAWLASILAFAVVSSVWLLPASVRPVWKKGIIVGSVACVLAAIALVSAFPDRVLHIFTHDPTATIRLDAYSAVWHRLVEPNVVFGVGYNAYQFYAKDASLIQGYAIHSRAGSDSSLLTLLATTGVLGTALFLLPFGYGVYWHGSTYLRTRKAQHLLFIWAVVVLLVHSLFENSLLYPHILMLLAILSAILADI